VAQGLQTLDQDRLGFVLGDHQGERRRRPELREIGVDQHPVAVPDPEIRHLDALGDEPVGDSKPVQGGEGRGVDDRRPRRVLRLGQAVEDDEVHPPIREPDGKGQSRRAGAHDHHIRPLSSHPPSPLSTGVDLRLGASRSDVNTR
jgi:hypothetical protein